MCDISFGSRRKQVESISIILLISEAKEKVGVSERKKGNT